MNPSYYFTERRHSSNAGPAHRINASSIDEAVQVARGLKKEPASYLLIGASVDEKGFIKDKLAIVAPQGFWYLLEGYYV